MWTVILAGGFGTRLREETEFRPKPLIEIGDRPILWHIMKHYSVFGQRDFILCLGYKGDLIRQYILNYNAMNTDCVVELGSGAFKPLEPAHDEHDWRVILAETGLLTQTGGRLRNIAKYIEEDTFLATYGDSLSDVPIDKVIEYHHHLGRVATVCAMRTIQRFGVITSTNGLADDFQEKPPLSADWINGGFYVFSRRIFDYIHGDETFEHEPLRRLIQEQQLAVYRHDGCHRAMDTIRDWTALNEEWNSGNAPWKTW